MKFGLTMVLGLTFAQGSLLERDENVCNCPKLDFGCNRWCGLAKQQAKKEKEDQCGCHWYDIGCKRWCGLIKKMEKENEE